MILSLRSFSALSGFFALVLLISGCPARGGGTPVTIRVQASQTTLLAGQIASIQATVLHSGGNPGVLWSLSGPDCPENCGSLSSLSTNPVTYTAPQFVSADTTVTVLAEALADTSKWAFVTLMLDKSLSTDCPSGNESVLNGQYAFLIRGGSTSGSVITAGSFTADGLGNVTAGLEDMNGSLSGPQTNLTLVAGGSVYSVGSDNRGCLGLVNSQGGATAFRFALSGITGGIATRGRIIEFDDQTGTGTRAEGILARQDPSSFMTSQIQGNYAFGLGGQDSVGARLVTAGVYHAAGGVLSDGNTDSDDGGVLATNVTGVTGTYTVAGDGRGTVLVNGGAGTGFVLYMISSDVFIVLSTDTLSGPHPIQSGEFRKQTLGNFDDTSLSAQAVVTEVGVDTVNGGPIASVGLLTPNGLGIAGLVLDENDAGVFMPLQSSAGTYSVGANGRTSTLGLGASSPVLYLIGADKGFLVGTDVAATSGRFEPQTGGPFSDASLSGAYSYGTEGAGVAHRLTAVGSDVFDGFVNNQATEDESTPTGLFPNLVLPNNSYFFAPGSVPSGRGTLDSGGGTVAYVISPTKVVYINVPAIKPRLVVLEK
jgi:hypothetical protein